MGFGDVCINVDDVVDSILRCAQNEFVTEGVYADRTKNFFPLCDTNNCKRIYEIINC